MPKNQQIDQLRPKQCPNCIEPNKPDSRFCAKCRMVLTYDAYTETLEKQQEKESEVQLLKDSYEGYESYKGRDVSAVYSNHVNYSAKSTASTSQTRSACTKTNRRKIA